TLYHMLYGAIGLACSACVAGVAAWRSRSAGGYYDRGVYGLDARAHRRYASISLAFAVFFAAMLVLHAVTAGIVGLALYALVAVFYATSFLRGASDIDE
ncbi:MAG: hypothetical protein WA304_13700, partial [Candidatus Cybelea sp.]